MTSKHFDYTKQYSAKELAEIFELPIFVERKGWQDTGFRYKITGVSDIVIGEGWSRGKPFQYKKTYTKDDRFLVCRDQELKYKVGGIGLIPFPVVVMATMSSGKSTLINALLDKCILPSNNSACTAKSYRIFDNDNDDITEIEPVFKNGEKATISNSDWATVLKEANENPEIDRIIIRTQIKGVLNTQRRLVIVDTPGTNNSQDESHSKITLDILSKIKEGLIIYIINATQFGINDDKVLLLKVCETLKENKDLSVIFVVNKCDEFEEEKGELLEKVMCDIYNYIVNDCGIASPNIIPTSALLATIFQKVLRRETLTRTERRKFKQYFALNPPIGLNLSSYIITQEHPNPIGCIEIDGDSYRMVDIIGALNNTGIPYLERYIQRAQIESERLSKISPK